MGISIDHIPSGSRSPDAGPAEAPPKRYGTQPNGTRKRAAQPLEARYGTLPCAMTTSRVRE